MGVRGWLVLSEYIFVSALSMKGSVEASFGGLHVK